MTPATRHKRQQLLAFVEQVVVPETAVQGIVAIGSVANGRARPDSDIDAVAFLDPYDDYILPAEAIWRATDDTFHSIFVEDEALQSAGVAFDFLRLNLAHWSDPQFEWPEGRCAELAGGWLAYDRRGTVAQLIAERTHYPDAWRVARLDEAVTWLDQHLGENGPQLRWETLGPIIAHDRLNAAYHYLVQALFAVNRVWRPWRNREMSALLDLPWLPDEFNERILPAATAPGLDFGDYMRRADILAGLFLDIQAQLQKEGVYGLDPIGEAFVRAHRDQPGYAWNLAEWSARRAARLDEQ